MQVEMWSLDRIKPYEKNPRINDDAVAPVVQSINEFGFRQPIVVDPDGVNRDAQLSKLRENCEFKVYTANNALYRTRYAEIVPVEHFPVVLFQDSTGGHVHAAGRTMIPRTPDELYSDLRQGFQLYQQTREAEKTGALKTKGYSWDDAISPTMYLSPEDCPDGYCPVEPTDTWKPGDRVRDLLFDEVRDNRNAFLTVYWPWRWDIRVSKLTSDCFLGTRPEQLASCFYPRRQWKKRTSSFGTSWTSSEKARRTNNSWIRQLARTSGKPLLRSF